LLVEVRSSLRDDGLRLAADLDDLRDVVLIRAGVRDVPGVERSQRAGDDDRDEEEERRERDVVPAEPAPGEVPGAPPRNRDAVLFGGKQRRGVEREGGARFLRGLLWFDRHL